MWKKVKMRKDDVILSDYLYYDESSPTCLRWKVELRSGRGNGRVMTEVDGVAGTARNKAGYAVIGLKSFRWLVHKVIYCLINGEPYTSFSIDHEDGNVFNNRISNLAKKTQRANMQNRRMSSSNTSGVTGVTRTQGGYWRARWYSTELEASGRRGKELSKSFSVSKLGESVAFEAACKYRADAIAMLNLSGANYKERHGF